MNIKKLKNHVKLCTRNLRSTRVRCCAECPFEAEILSVYPSMWTLFAHKRSLRPALRKDADFHKARRTVAQALPARQGLAGRRDSNVR